MSAAAIEAARRLKRGEGLGESPHVVIFKLLEEVDRLQARIATASVVDDFGGSILVIPGPLIGRRVRLVLDDAPDATSAGDA